MVDLTKLHTLEAKGYCWSIGKSRIGLECRIYPVRPYFEPVIIECARTLECAIKEAIQQLGDQKPRLKNK